MLWPISCILEMKQAAFSVPPQCILNTSEHILVSKDNKDIPQVCSYVSSKT